MYAPGLLEPLPNTLHSPVQAPVAVAQYRGSKVCAQTLLLWGVSIIFDLRDLAGLRDLACLDRHRMAAFQQKDLSRSSIFTRLTLVVLHFDHGLKLYRKSRNYTHPGKRFC